MPCIVNAGWTHLIDNPEFPLYIYPTFLKSGKHHYIIENEENERQYFGSFIARFREEEIYKYQKIKPRKQLVRKFEKEASVFQPWKADT